MKKKKKMMMDRKIKKITKRKKRMMIGRKMAMKVLLTLLLFDPFWNRWIIQNLSNPKLRNTENTVETWWKHQF